MENTDNNMDKAKETLIKELESMSTEGLRDFFMFFYKLNHHDYNMISPEKFEDFLEVFDKNPFKVNEDRAFKKQLIDSIIKYTTDHMSLITAAVLIKKKFTTSEIIQNYYSNVNVFDNNWF